MEQPVSFEYRYTNKFTGTEQSDSFKQKENNNSGYLDSRVRISSEKLGSMSPTKVVNQLRASNNFDLKRQVLTPE